MKRAILPLILLLLAASAFASGEEPVRRTIVVRDGKVITDGRDVVHFELGRRAYLGVQTVDLTSELRDHLGAPKDSGVMVGAVEDNSPADKAGLKVGDIVVSVDGKDIESAAALRLALRGKKDGDTVRVEVLRGRTRQTFVATVAEREMRNILPMDLDALPRALGTPEFRARLETLAPRCNELQERIKDLEGRLKELEKKLQK
jgi:membrane-associated protease RseP (regulator of RpoE activity)